MTRYPDEFYRLAAMCYMLLIRNAKADSINLISLVIEQIAEALNYAHLIHGGFDDRQKRCHLSALERAYEDGSMISYKLKSHDEYMKPKTTEELWEHFRQEHERGKNAND